MKLKLQQRVQSPKVKRRAARVADLENHRKKLHKKTQQHSEIEEVRNSFWLRYLIVIGYISNKLYRLSFFSPTRSSVIVIVDQSNSSFSLIYINHTSLSSHNGVFYPLPKSLLCKSPQTQKEY